MSLSAAPPVAAVAAAAGADGAPLSLAPAVERCCLPLLLAVDMMHGVASRTLQYLLSVPFHLHPLIILASPLGSRRPPPPRAPCGLRPAAPAVRLPSAVCACGMRCGGANKLVFIISLASLFCHHFVIHSLILISAAKLKNARYDQTTNRTHVVLVHVDTNQFGTITLVHVAAPV